MKVVNKTGILPVDTKCLVLLDPVKKKTDSGLSLPPEYLERQQMATTYATFIDAGGNAFEDWNGLRPQPGQRIVVDKYCGVSLKAGELEDLYRLCQDDEVLAVIQ